MPYFYVDGLRDGQPAQALYIQADDADAAKSRATQLGMAPTGVRPARTMSNTSQPKIWPLYFFPFLLMLIGLLGIMLDARLLGRSTPMALIFMITLIPQMMFCVIYHMNRSHQRQQEMQAQIDDMRTLIVSRNLLDGRSS